LIGKTIAIKAAAVAAIATAAVLCVVALGQALYFALTDIAYMHPAGAALVLAAIMAVFALLVAWLTFRKGGAHKAPEEPASLTDRVIGLAKERPIIATVAGLAAGFIFLRNPALATIVAAALSGAPTDQGRRK